MLVPDDSRDVSRPAAAAADYNYREEREAAARPVKHPPTSEVTMIQGCEVRAGPAHWGRGLCRGDQSMSGLYWQAESVSRSLHPSRQVQRGRTQTCHVTNRRTGLLDWQWSYLLSLTLSPVKSMTHEVADVSNTCTCSLTLTLTLPPAFSVSCRVAHLFFRGAAGGAECRIAWNKLCETVRT